MMESTRRAAQPGRRQEDWTRESEAAALVTLRRAATGDGAKPVILAYARQSKSDFDKDGKLRGPSIAQQFDSVEHLSDLRGLPVETFCDADRSGKETSRRPDYQRLIAHIDSAPPGEVGAVAFYDGDRLHRNDIQFFQFMADMAERRILVFDNQGLISNADKLSWKMKAIFAQEERERTARKVRHNLGYLKRHGHLLGVVPQGYRRVDGEVVEDPEAAPIIRQIFALYGTGHYSFQTLAEHLNRQGIKPARGAHKDHHTRPKAVIFTGDVVKDIIKSPVYLGHVRVGRWRSDDEHWIEGKHPALVDEQTWTVCNAIRVRNRRRTNNTRTRRSYPLTRVLRCAQCGGPMHGEAAVKASRADLYYVCRQAHSRSAAHPPPVPCDARRIIAPRIEDAIRSELHHCLPGDDGDEEYRDRLREAVGKAPDPKKAVEAAIRRLDDQLDRARRLYEFGEYEWAAFVVKRDEIRDEQNRLREQAATRHSAGDLDWCRSQVVDLLAAWDAADGEQRSRLLATIFDRIEAEARPEGGLRLIGVPRDGWRPFFEYVVHERETGLEPATSSLEGTES